MNLSKLRKSLKKLPLWQNLANSGHTVMSSRSAKEIRISEVKENFQMLLFHS